MSERTESVLYAPLQHRESFRLLKMRPNPSGDTWGGTLVEDRLPLDRCTVNVTKYVAVSYAWGDPTFNVPSEDSIEISLSLSTALGHILFEAAEAGRINIWIDQICINQRKYEERKQQVSLMSRIFAGAEQVIGWLGPAFEGSDEALDDLILFAGACDEASQDEFLRVARCRFGQDLTRNSVAEYYASILRLGSESRLRLIRLLTLPWFQRRWVAQEACLASNLRVHCGHRSISGAQLFRAIKGIQTIITPIVSPWLQRPFRNAFTLFETRELVRLSAKGECRVSFAHVLQALSLFDCKEDQDRINALYGIVESSNSWFTPAYCSTPDLYVRFALAHMRHFQSFEILHFAGITEPKVEKKGEEFTIHTAWPADDLPSWIPDWRIRHRQFPMISVDGGSHIQEPASTTFEVPFDPSCKSLTLTGKLLKTLIKPCGIPHLDLLEVQEDPRYQLTVDPWCSRIFVEFLEMLDQSWARKYLCSETFTHWFDSIVGAGEDPSQPVLRFARTLIMNGGVKSRERAGCIVPKDKILEYFLEYAKVNFVLDPIAADIALTAMFEDEKNMGKAAAFGYLAEHVCRYRTLFVGEDSTVGLGSPGIRPNDRICFFSGLKTPFVVHPRGEHFQLRGECYVDGLMDSTYEELDGDELAVVLE